jgi:hypothetical protein
MSEHHPPEEAERLLHRLHPAPPSPALMRRLRDACPSAHRASQLTPARRPRAPIRLAAAAAAAAALALAAQVWLPRPSQNPRRLHTVDVPSATPSPEINSTAQAPVSPAAESTHPTASVFLPVEASRHLVSLQSVPTIQQPDTAPLRLLRAVLIDDLTAVGAETDAALHLRRAREVYFPLHSPIY